MVLLSSSKAKSSVSAWERHMPIAPHDFTFYVADPISSIETRSLPTLTRSYPRRFTFYVADPISSIPDLWPRKPAARGLSAVISDERSNREKILLRQSSLRSRSGGVGGYGGTSVVVQAPTALKSA